MKDIIFKTLLLKGESGAISGIEKTSTSGLEDTYTITYNDGTTADFKVKNGKGISDVEKTATSGLEDTYTITYNDATTSTFTVTNAKSITSITKTSTSGLEDTYTITYNDEDSDTFIIKNGRGITKIERTSTNGLIDTYTITYNDATTSTFTVTNGANSRDDNLAEVENHAQATRRYNKGEHIIYNGDYYVVTSTYISQGANLVEGTNIENAVIGDEIEALQNKTQSITHDSNGTAITGALSTSGKLSASEIGTNDINIKPYNGTESDKTNTSTTFIGRTQNDGVANPSNALTIFGGKNGYNESWSTPSNDYLYRGCFVTSFGIPYNTYNPPTGGGNIDLCGDALGGNEYKYEQDRNYAYAGMLEGAEEVNIELDACGVYLLICNSFTITTGDIYGATVRLITAHGNSGTPNSLQLGQTQNAPATITLATNNMLKIANSATTRGTQYNLIRIM